MRKLPAALSLILLAGCKASELTAAIGHYQGILTETAGGRTAQTQVVGEILSPGFLQLDVKVTAAGAQPRSWEYRLSASARGQVSLIEASTHATTALVPTADACYIDSDAPSPAQALTRVCYQANQVRIDLPAGQSFILNRASPGDMPVLEAPADFKLSELVQRSLTRSFSSQLEFQNVVIARLNSESAHLNLIPHFSLGDIMSLASITSSWMGLVRMVGDLAPFLIPSNWFKARAAAFQSDAEKFGFRLMQADAGNIATGLSYNIARDSLAIAKMQDERAQVARIRRRVYDLERLGFLPEGWTDTIDSVLNAVDKTILGLQQVISQEYAGLAQATGFFNPRAIRSVTIDNDLSIDHPETFDVDQASQLALTRAAELKQMDYLIAAAKTQRTERYFDWLDPSGGAGAAIGLGMGAYIAIASAQLQQAVLKRQQLQAQILQNVANTDSSLNEAIAAYELAKKNIVIQDSLVNNYLSEGRFGISVSPSELINALGGQMQANLDAINARFQYLVAHDTMERILFQGAYSQLGADEF